MPLQMSCPGCQKSYKFPDDKRGKQVRCPACSHVFRVGKPTADAAAPEGREPEAPRAPKSAAKPRSTAPERSPAKPAPRSRSATPAKGGIADLGLKMDAELSYIDAGSNIVVTVDMFQGKVVKKASTANWPAAYPSDKGK